MKIPSISPIDGQELGSVERMSRSQIDDLVAKSKAAQKDWAALPLAERIRHLQKVHDAILARKEELAHLVTQEMGMVLEESIFDIEHTTCAFLQWYMDHAAEALAPTVTFEDENTLHRVTYEPMGVVCAIVPWNFPVSSFAWQAGQNLLAGNTVIMKQSKENILSTALLEEIIQSAGLPPHVFAMLYGDGEDGSYLAAHPDVNLICFTGSTPIGRHLYEVAAQKFIPVLLEMGGSAPGIVFEDVEIDHVLESIYFNRFFNCGQVCDGEKRLLVHASKMEELCTKLTELVKSKKVGNPLEEGVTFGPLSSWKQAKIVGKQVSASLSMGAKALCGGAPLPDLGEAYFAPTLLTQVTPDMPVWAEEVFGPVLPIMAFQTEAEAIELANATNYGLGSYVFTNDRDRFERVAAQLKAGMVAHNNQYYLEPWNPFGGYKLSGLGRNHGIYGFHDVCQKKVVSIEK